jgi:hypothetical protein
VTLNGSVRECDALKEFWKRRLARRSSEAASRVGGSNSVVESQPSKLLVAGSIPVSRSKVFSRGTKSAREKTRADVAQLAERVLGKDEVTSSILVIGSSRLGRSMRPVPSDAAKRPSRVDDLDGSTNDAHYRE